MGVLLERTSGASVIFFSQQTGEELLCFLLVLSTGCLLAFSGGFTSRLQIQNWALGERYNIFCNEGTSSVLNELLSARSRLGLGCDPTEMPSVSKEAGLCWKLRGKRTSAFCVPEEQRA
ncbi:uncharacterized protein LOC102073396 [Zonotrichia albicollis]|uniref:uncharacterized protein LOC102073396 n=1 Tax=Zonotrichia albicollis TaxID=44394 RepID=UPI003D80E5CE